MNQTRFNLVLAVANLLHATEGNEVVSIYNYRGNGPTVHLTDLNEIPGTDAQDWTEKPLRSSDGREYFRYETTFQNVTFFMLRDERI